MTGGVDDDPEIEESPLSTPFTEHGITVEVKIFRLAEGSEGWSLEVVSPDNASTVWDDLFATDAEAYRAFQQTVEREGIGTFLMPEGTRH